MSSRSSSTRPHQHSQRGFSLVMMFAAIAGLMAVVTLYVIAPGARNGIGTGAVASAQAAGIIQQGALLEGAFLAKIEQGDTVGGISYDNSSPDGMLTNSDTKFSKGLINRPIASPDAFVATGPLDGSWIYRGGKIRFPGVGVDANYDRSFILTNLKRDVCEQINGQLHRDTTIPVVGTLASLRAAMPIDLVTTTDLTPYSGGFTGWNNGCLQSSDGKYVYFHVVAAQ